MEADLLAPLKSHSLWSKWVCIWLTLVIPTPCPCQQLHTHLEVEKNNSWLGEYGSLRKWKRKRKGWPALIGFASSFLLFLSGNPSKWNVTRRNFSENQSSWWAEFSPPKTLICTNVFFRFLACGLSERHSQAGLMVTLWGRLLERAYKVTVKSTSKHRRAKVCQAQRLSELGVPPPSASSKCPFYPGGFLPDFWASELCLRHTRWAREQRKQQSQSWSKIQVHVKF